MAAAPPPPSPPHEVSELRVSPLTPPPNLVASYPTEGEAVPPGVLILKLTFDQRMTATGFDITAATGAEAPSCVKTPRLLNDGKTFVLLCTALPGRSYELAFNAQPDAEGGFQNLSERRARPVTLSFKTTAGEPIRSLEEAMRRQNLTRLEVPIQESPRR
ncbi:MAG: hypothetical protein KIS90_09165 [Phenylobacterium sp.]|nr:hypothetical protein [Phenylobacterium sp.]